MKRTPLRRVTPLRRTPLAKVNKKQGKELYQRRKLKRLLLKEGPQTENGWPLCWHCEKLPDWRGLELVHLIHLSAGGKTEHQNCEVWCVPCHKGSDGHKTELIKTKEVE